MAEKPTIAQVVQVVREGKKIILPERLSYDDAVQAIVRQKNYEEEYINVRAEFSALPQEGAVALLTVLTREFGYVHSRRGSNTGQMEVKIGVNETVSVPWGEFVVPGMDGFLETDAARNTKGMIVFVLGGRIKRMHDSIFQSLVKMVREEIRSNSIYKGKAWRIRTTDAAGRLLPMPEPEFIELNFETEKQLSFPRDVHAALRINLWSFIENTAAYRKAGSALKRGVLLVGGYGTGKSMTATVTAIKATRQGWTYIVADRANELADVSRLAREYGPAVLFVEDIDRALSGERSISMDEMLNVVDGIESKGSELVIVLTTNDLDSIHEAMLRPGRIDAVITLTFPDAEASEKLLRIYSGVLLDKDEDISEAANLIAGNRTAAVAEVARRAISASIDSTGNVPERLTGEDLREAALSVVNQMKSLERAAKDRELSPQERAAMIYVDGTRNTHSAGSHSGNGKATDIPAIAGLE